MAKKINLNADIKEITKSILAQTRAVNKNTKAINSNNATRQATLATLESMAAVLSKQTAALEQLTASLNRNTGSQRNNNKQGLFGVKTNRLLSGSFATLRSQLLLVSFGYLMLKRSVGALLQQHSDFEASIARINQGLHTTGRFSQATSEQMLGIADALELSTGVAGTQINEVVGLGITFTNISTSIMPRFTKSVLDMTAGMNSGAIQAEQLKSNSIVLGKALNDPIQGISALTRVGVQFTDQQKNQIRAAVTFGDVMQAQKIILEEVEKQFKDKASLDTYEKTIRELNTTFDNLLRVIGEDLAPVIKDLAEDLTDFIRETKPQDIYDFAESLVFAGGSALLLQRALSSTLTSLAAGTLSYNGLRMAVGKYVVKGDGLLQLLKKQNLAKKLLLGTTQLLKGRLGFLGLVASLTGLQHWFRGTTKTAKDLNDELLESIENSSNLTSPELSVGDTTGAGVADKDTLIKAKILELEKLKSTHEATSTSLQTRIDETNDSINSATTGSNELSNELMLMTTVYAMLAQAQNSQTGMFSRNVENMANATHGVVGEVRDLNSETGEIDRKIESFTNSFARFTDRNGNVFGGIRGMIEFIKASGNDFEKDTVASLLEIGRRMQEEQGNVYALKNDDVFQQNLEVIQKQMDKLKKVGATEMDIVSQAGAALLDALSFGMVNIDTTLEPFEDARGTLEGGARALHDLASAVTVHKNVLIAEKAELEKNKDSRLDLIQAKQNEIDTINDLQAQISQYQSQLSTTVDKEKEQAQAIGKIDESLKGTLHTYDMITNQALVSYNSKLTRQNTLFNHQVQTFDNQLLPIILKYIGHLEKASGQELINEDGLYDTQEILKQFYDFATLDEAELTKIDEFAKKWQLATDEIKDALLAGKEVEVVQATLAKDASEEDISAWATKYKRDVEDLKAQLDALPDGGTLVQGEDEKLIINYNAQFAKLLEMYEKFIANKPVNFFNNIAEAFKTTTSILKEYTDLMFDVANAITRVTQTKIDMERATINNTHADRMEMISNIRNDAVRRVYEKKAQQQKEKDEKELFKKHKKNQIAMAKISAAQSIMNILMEPAPPGMDFVTAGIIRGIQTALVIGTTDAQIQQIKAQESFARGGLVTGSLHSGGGVNANLEGGEFVLNRRATSNIGADALDTLNSGGRLSGGNQVVVNVTFQGNVNSSDFIEDEVIPTIQDAIQRGISLGEN